MKCYSFSIFTPDFSHRFADFYYFYQILQSKVNEIPGKNKYLLLGDSNVKMGEIWIGSGLTFENIKTLEGIMKEEKKIHTV